MPLSVDEGSWDEVVTPLELEVQYWIQRGCPRRDGNKFRIRIRIRSDGRL